ncbi:MAG: FeoA family protein [Syntrophomonadaceae bacterium]|nr:FeoA family protein [Syntrophomonadaceae bacterium]MDD3889405.1 FeoA family protein [Syntrophomonadaceae bacterium]MDD4549521.1 FeoA family protein [Syntrophomonadaceae bacterium]
MVKTLIELKPGEKARVKRVTAQGTIRRRIVDMGLVPGTEIEMERYAPLGDPVELKLNDYHLSLRKAEADTIILESLEEI